MNETVAKFIEEQKKRQEEEQKKQREKHLLNLGLVDNSKTGKKYCSTSVSEAYRKDYGYIYHDENGYFRYDGEPTALDISDEDYEELCKVCPQENKTIICKENVASINKYTNNTYSHNDIRGIKPSSIYTTI